jgi:hypothetical protein
VITTLFLVTGCSDIFKTELPPIADCTADSNLCSYTDTIQPIFDAYCTKCHGGQGGLDLTSYSHLMSGGNNGPIIIPENADESLLVQVLEGTSLIVSQMPPTSDGKMLDEIYTIMISKWIQAGANNN